MSDAIYVLVPPGVWRATGDIVNAPPPPPDALKPVGTNTGASPTLTHYTTAVDFTTTSNGQTITGLNIDGRIIVKHSNVTITNCWPHGANTPGGMALTGLIDCTFAGITGLTVDRSTLIANTPIVTLDGIYGHDYHISNCNIGNVVDGCSWQSTGNVNVTIAGNYVHDLTALTPDPNHSLTNHTGNDGVQGQGGGIISITGNNFALNPSLQSNYFPTPSGATIQGLLIAPNVSQVNHLTVDGNWFDYGKVGIVMIPGPSGTGAPIVVTNNRFGRNLATIFNAGRTGQHPIIIDPAVTVVGLRTTSGLDTSNGNVWDDDGTPVYIDRASP